MTDYAYLDYPNNLPLKKELIKLINLLNANKIHNWVDFATLAKITNNSKYLYYLNSFEIGVFEDSYKDLTEIIKKNNFYVWQCSDLLTNIANPELPLFKTATEKFSSSEAVIQSMLKWVSIWNYKLIDNNFTSLKIDKDFIYNKEIFLEVKEIKYCGIKLNIPKNVDLLNRIRFTDSKQTVWCHSPKKRENAEKNFGYSNLGNYK
jgi:hypothetical protein